VFEAARRKLNELMSKLVNDDLGRMWKEAVVH
jgi:hypothetical protein